VRHFKIDEMLSADDRAAYEALMLDPRQTVDSLLAWLKGRGYVNITRSSVQRHRRYFETDVKEIRKSAKIAGQFAALARAQGGAGGLADAGQFRFEQMFLERLFAMKGDDRMDGKQWSDFGKAMTALLENRQKYETLRAEWDEKARRAARAVMNDKALKARDSQRIAKDLCELFGVTPPQPADAGRELGLGLPEGPPKVRGMLPPPGAGEN
jgi:hypothetical protein